MRAAMLACLAVAASAQEVKLLVLQRMTDVRTTQAECGAQQFFSSPATLGEQRCWLDDGWKSVAATGLAAIEHFNNRDPTYVPELANLSGCDKFLNATVLDSGSMGGPSTKALLSQFGDTSQPDVIVGPSRSAASMPSAVLAGVVDIPQISYWATSAKLDDQVDYPRFMRAIPTDDAVAYSVCQFWSSFGYKRTAMIHSSDAYGDAYKNSLLSHCAAAGIEVSIFAYDATNSEAIAQQVTELAATNIRIVMWVGSDAGFDDVMRKAYELGLFDSTKGAMWVVSDGIGPAAIAQAAAGLNEAPPNVMSGILSLVPGYIGPCAQFVNSGFQGLSLVDVAKYLPNEWTIDQNFLDTFDAPNSGNLRDIGTYEYDAVAALGLLACKVAPTGPLPSTFGTDVWNAKEELSFQGLTGNLRLDGFGNRDIETASFSLYNVLVDQTGAYTTPLRANYDQASKSWNWEGGSVEASGLVFMGDSTTAPPDLYIAPVIKLLVLQRMSDVRTTKADCGADSWKASPATFNQERCWLGDSWKAVATPGLAAIEHFNNRDPTYVPEFADLAGCDKTFDVMVLDSGSMGTPSVQAILRTLESGNRPHVIVGPARSAATMPSATLAGVADIPQISYWATSGKLDSTSDYPRFLRTIPTDDAVAFSVCKFWANDMKYTQAAMIHSNDAYGEAYMLSIVSHCGKAGVMVSVFTYDAEKKEEIVEKVTALEATNIRVILWVGSDTEIGIVMTEAYRRGLLDPVKGAMWVVSDGVSPAAVAGSLAGDSDAPTQAISGFIRIGPVGGSGHRYETFVNGGFKNLSLAGINKYLPDEWAIDQNFLDTFDAANSGTLRDIGAYEYDAVAAVGLFACKLVPTGPLPDSFGTDLWDAKEELDFSGLTNKVRFSEIGNRASEASTFELYNVLTGADGTFSHPVRAKFDSATLSWRWEGESREASGLVYLGDSATPPPNLWDPSMAVGSPSPPSLPLPSPPPPKRDVEATPATGLATALLQLKEAAVAGRPVHVTLMSGEYGLSSTAVFDSSIVASEVWIEGEPGTTILAESGQGSSLVTVKAGAPPVHISNARILGQVRVEGGELSLDDTSIEGFAGSFAVAGRLLGESVLEPERALHIQGGRVTLTRAVLRKNMAGGVYVEAANLTCIESVFEENNATKGGAILVDGGSFVRISAATRFLRNVATESGGALQVNSGYVELLDRTVFSDNAATTAGGGNFFYLAVDSTLVYTLPCPPGRWLNVQRGDTLAFTPGADDSTEFPYKCPAGVLGGLSGADQSSPLCKKPCPAGSFCSVATTEPVPCPKGHYCPLGTPAAIVCPSGTYGQEDGLSSAGQCMPTLPGFWATTGSTKQTPCSPGTVAPNASMGSCRRCAAGSYQEGEGARACKACPTSSWCSEGSPAPSPCAAGKVGLVEGLTSADQCEPCPRGAWCSAGIAIECPENTYNDQVGADNQGGCEKCPDFSTSLPASKNKSSCLCNEDYYDADEDPDQLPDCQPCPLGSNCIGTGLTVSSLPLRPGYYRTSRSSVDLRRCPDASSPDTACSNINATTCKPWTTGPYCTLCNITDGSRYYEPSKSACELCNDVSGAVLTKLGGIAAVVLLVLGLLVWYKPYERVPKAIRNRFSRLTFSFVMAIRSPVKQMIAFYQIVTRVETVFAVSMPPSVAALLERFEVFNLKIDALGLPMDCMRLSSFFDRLFFVVLAPYVLAVLIFAWGMTREALYTGGTPGLKAGLIRALPYLLILSFFAFPMVSSLAFQVFNCETFDDGTSYLKVDYLVECNSDEYDRVKVLSWLAIALYPLGNPLGCLVLLLCARKAILTERPTPLSISLRFLHQDYEPPMFWWETIEIVKKARCLRPLILTAIAGRDQPCLALAQLFLVGFCVLIQPNGSIPQLIIGFVFTLVVLLFTSIAGPYTIRLHDYFSMLCNFSLMAVLFLCLVLKIGFLAEEIEDLGVGSVRFRALYLYNPAQLSVLMASVLLPAVIVAAIMAVVQVHHSARQAARIARLEREALVERGRMLQPPTCRWQLQKDDEYIVFLSHFKEEAGSDARCLSDLIQRMTGCHAYLDSSHLIDLRTLFNEGIHKTDVLVILATHNVFTRPWCLLEMWEAAVCNVPIVLFPVMGRGFDLSETVKLLDNLETELSSRNPACLDEVMAHVRKQGVTDVHEVQDVLLAHMGLVSTLERAGRPASSELDQRLCARLKKTDTTELDLWLTAHHQEVVQRLKVLSWQPCGSDNTIIASVQMLVDTCARSLGLATPEWTDGWKLDGQPKIPARLALGTRVQHRSHGLGTVAKLRPASTYIQPMVFVSFDNGKTHGYKSNSWEELRTAKSASGRLNHLVKSATGSLRSLRSGGPLASAEEAGWLLIVCDRKICGMSARLLQQEIAKILKCEVVVGTDQVETWHSEVEPATRGIVLLQTRSVLHHPVRLLQLFEATGQRHPIVCAKFAGGGYQFQEVTSLLQSLSAELSQSEMAVLGTELGAYGHGVGQLVGRLRQAIPNAISIPFDPAAGDLMVDAAIRDIVQSLGRNSELLAKNAIRRCSSCKGCGEGTSALVAAEEVAMSVEEVAPRKRKGSKTNLGITCQVIPGAQGGQAEPSDANPPQPRSRKASKQKMVMNQGTYAEMVAIVNQGVINDDDESIA